MQLYGCLSYAVWLYHASSVGGRRHVIVSRGLAPTPANGGRLLINDRQRHLVSSRGNQPEPWETSVRRYGKGEDNMERYIRGVMVYEGV